MNSYCKFENSLQMAVILIAACSLRISTTVLGRSGGAGGAGGGGRVLVYHTSNKLNV